MLWWFLGCQNYQAQIVPAQPTTTDALEVILLDQRGEKQEKSDIRWFVNGDFATKARYLEPMLTTKGQQWSATVVAPNGEEISTQSVEIENTVPQIALQITPAQPVAGYSMECRASVFDIDQDQTIISYSWIDPMGTTFDSAEVSNTVVSEGMWTCTASVSDGTIEIQQKKEATVVELGELPELEASVLVNGSFESGTLQNWQTDGCQVLSQWENRSPLEGEYMLFGGQADCRVWQEIALLDLGYSAGHIDAMRLRVHIEGYLANKGFIDDYDDQIYFQILFLSEEGEQLGVLESLFAGEENWVYRDAQRMIPVGTRTIIAQIKGDWRADIQNDSFADAIALHIEPATLGQPILKKEPFLLGLTNIGQKIVWETDGVDHDPLVLWGENLEHQITNIQSTWIDEEHVVHVAEIPTTEDFGLSDIPYQVQYIDIEPASFTPAPQPDENFSIAWLGDNQEAADRFRTHISHIANRDPNLFFVVGDLVQTGRIHSEWQELWWEPLQEERFAQTHSILAARGNHDLDHPYAYSYVELPGNGSHYSFMMGDAFILVLNTHADVFPNDGFPGQYDFVIDSLESTQAKNAAFRIVAFHQGPFSNSSASSNQHQMYGNQTVRDYWVPVFEENDVDVVISGHYHSYQRGEFNGITYLVTGGGGSTLLEQEFDVWDWLSLDLSYQYTMMYREEERLSFETYNLEDELIDEFVVE